MRICHLTSVHPWFDTRVFYRQCVGLAALGHDVVFIVPEAAPGARLGVQVVAVKAAKGRIRRMTITVARVLIRALRVPADVYHFHDPELLPAALVLRLLGRKVVYDVHEDYEEDLQQRLYLAPFVRKRLARMVGGLERLCARFMSGIVTATDHIRKKFESHNPLVVAIHNYPNLDELTGADPMVQTSRNRVCYVGIITRSRGVLELVHSVETAGVELELAGDFESEELRSEAQRLSGWSRVHEWGRVARQELPSLLQRCFAGLVVFHPTANWIVAEPLKLFEYMSAGLPVVASNFPLWREIVEGERCGICVDPLNPEGIAQAIQWLRDHPTEARLMGERGRDAIRRRYNWATEVQRLEHLYRGLTA